MARSRQADLFSSEAQPDLFGQQAAVPAYRPDPDRVRRRLHHILAEARAADRLPWSPARLSLYCTIVPQLTPWLPDDEAAQLRFAFDEELARLTAG